MGSTLKDVIASCDPNTLFDALRALGMDSIIATQRTTLRMKVPATNAQNLATVLAIKPPDYSKASVIARAYARAGGVTGELTIAAANATPSTGQIAVSPNGDIVTLGTDAITLMDVEYAPLKGDVLLLENLPVTTNAISLAAVVPALVTLGVVILLEANVITGTVTGQKIILAPSASTAATGQARLDVAKTSIKFASADAAATATVKLLVTSAKDVVALLDSAGFQ